MEQYKKAPKIETFFDKNKKLKAFVIILAVAILPSISKLAILPILNQKEKDKALTMTKYSLVWSSVVLFCNPIICCYNCIPPSSRTSMANIPTNYSRHV